MPHSGYIIAPIVGALALGLIIGNKDKLRSGPAARPAAISALHGYLPLPNHSQLAPLLPVPPDPDSAASKRDREVRQAVLASPGTARFALAQADSITTHPRPIETFSCAFGTQFSAERTPVLFRLLAKVRFDVRASAFVLKQYYKRPRPFVAAEGTTCSHEEQEKLQATGSFPSAGSAVGWTFAKVLAQLNPANGERIMDRGYEYGQSRLICDGEWESDVEAGRKLGDLIFDRLRLNSEYRADLAKAKLELDRLKAAPIDGSTKCKNESIALASDARKPAAQSSSSS